MNKHMLVFLLVAIVGNMSAMATPRSETQMKEVARVALSRNASRQQQQGRELRLTRLKRTDMLAVYGYEQGESGFVVVAADDVAPAVVGCSDGSFTDVNPGVAWWLNAMDASVRRAVQKGKPMYSPTPNELNFPDAVTPMMTTMWSQDEPFNDLCPLGNDTVRCLTGCVATAMAQVMKFHSKPGKGQGRKTYNDNGHVGEVDYSETAYDYDLMIDSYKEDYSEEQARAVALLMRDCGVASNMRYGIMGSGTYISEAANGLQRYLGFPGATYIDRADLMPLSGVEIERYTVGKWMSMVYQELTENGPVIYGGADRSPDGGGHCFVLDGYREDGLVHVNWGWGGKQDGFYDIALLNPEPYSFTYQQDMVVGVKYRPVDLGLLSGSFCVEKPGDLIGMVGEDNLNRYEALTVTGILNSDDLDCLRMMTGWNGVNGRVHHLDLSGAQLPGDSLAARALAGCRNLRSLILPTGLKHIGRGAFARCERLTELTVDLTALEGQYVEDGIIYSDEHRTDIICCLPTKTGRVVVPESLTHLGQDAFSGCTMIEAIELPKTIEFIGSGAFANTDGLKELKLNRVGVPDVADDALDGMFTGSCILVVPAGMSNTFKQHPVWGIFKTIEIFGRAVVARAAYREYGDENPRLKWSYVNADSSVGKPVVVCEATKESPAGVYPIHLEQGSVEEGIFLVDGLLTIRPAEILATVGNYTRYEDEPNPDFEVKLTAEWKLDDTEESVVLERPWAETTADQDSRPGKYPIVLKGGQAVQNYQFTFGPSAVLTVLDRESRIIATESPSSPVIARHALDGLPVGTDYHGLVIERHRDGSVRKSIK